MLRVISPTGAVATREVPAPIFPEEFAGKSIHILDNTKHNARDLLSDLARRIEDAFGLGPSVIHRKDYAAVGASDEMLDDIASRADLVLVGTAD